METRTLKYFLAIAREENMTAAAKQLHVSQSALSRQMTELEESLGKKLFIRTNRQTLLTEDGMHLRQRAEEIISLMEKTEMELMAADEAEIMGEVHIGAGETQGFKLIALAIKRTTEKYPGIRFSVYSASAPDVAEKLEHGLLDFGLMFEPVAKERYQHLDLPYSDRVGLIVRKDDPLASQKSLAQKELQGIPLLISSRISPDKVLPALSRKSIQALDIRGTYNLIYNASLLVEQGMGSALAIDGLIQTGEDSPFQFIPVTPAVKMNLTFVWKKYHMITRAQEVFLEELRKIINDQGRHLDTMRIPC